MNNSESGTAVSQEGASIARRADTNEQANAHGQYEVKIISPYEHQREDYIALQAYRNELIEKSAWIEENLPKQVIYTKLKRIRGVLSDLNERMNAMTYVKDTFSFNNLVTTEGKNFALDTVMTGSAYTGAWYLGLVDATTPTFDATDTMSSHVGWSENTNYSEASRPTTAWSSASAGSKALSSALDFSINALTQTVSGCFLVAVATKGGSTGTLYSAGAFTGGDKAVTTGDTLQVSYTASL